MNILRSRRLAVILGVAAICFLGTMLYKIVVANSPPPLVSIAIDTMTDWTHSGIGFLRQPNGINASRDEPYVSSKTRNKAIVTIPYSTNIFPVCDVKVYLVRNQETNEWKAISFSDGGGNLHPVVDGCGLCGQDKPYNPTQKWPN